MGGLGVLSSQASTAERVFLHPCSYFEMFKLSVRVSVICMYERETIFALSVKV